jgi:hypothetical protein
MKIPRPRFLRPLAAGTAALPAGTQTADGVYDPSNYTQNRMCQISAELRGKGGDRRPGRLRGGKSEVPRQEDRQSSPCGKGFNMFAVAIGRPARPATRRPLTGLNAAFVQTPPQWERRPQPEHLLGWGLGPTQGPVSGPVGL